MKTCALLLLAISGQVGDRPQDQAAALTEYRAASAEDKSRWRYLTTPPGQAETGIDWQAAISWAVCHASQAADLGAARPVVKGPTVLRIDLEALGWKFEDWQAVLADYPYQDSENPLFVRGDWLLVQLLDSTQSDAYLRLQFGDPKLTRDELLKRLEVDRKRARDLNLDHGLVEIESQVAIQRVRVLEFFPRLGGYAAGTRDFFTVAADNSPLQLADLEGLKHDGEEWIVGTPRQWPGGTGVLQTYFLANGAGALVAEAPVRLVEDRTRFRQMASIRFPGSCMACHRAGLNAPTKNGLATWISSGIQLQSSSVAKAARLERWHLADTGPLVARAGEDTAAAADWITYGRLTPDEAVDNMAAAAAWHDQPLEFAQAAAELRTSERRLADGLAIAAAEGDAGGHLVALLLRLPIRRDVWESAYLNALESVEN